MASHCLALSNWVVSERRLTSRHLHLRSRLVSRRSNATLLLNLIFFLFALSAQADTPLKIGAIPSLIGPAGEQGKNWHEGAMLAIEELQASGKQVSLISDDDQSNPSKAATAFNKLATINKVNAIVGGTWDYLAEAVYPLAKQHSVPFITMTNPPEILSTQAKANPWIFTNAMSLSAEMRAMEEFIKARKVKSIGIITVDVPFGTSHGDLVHRIALRNGLTVIDTIALPLEGFMSVLKLAAKKMADKKPDLIYIVNDASGLDLFLRELKILGGTSTVLTTQHLLDAYEISKDLTRFKNTYGVYPLYKNTDFDKKFQARFKHPPRVYAASGYDAIMFLAQTLDAGIDLTDPTAKFTYEGLTGPHRLPARSRSIADTEAVIMGFDTGAFAPTGSAGLQTGS